MNDGDAAHETDLPAWVVERLTEAFRRVQNTVAGRKLWHERFTDADRAVFAQPWPEVWEANKGTIGMWCRARGVSWNCGIAEAAFALGFLDRPTKDAIVAALPAEATGTPGTAVAQQRRDVVPSWNKALGELRYRGQVIRQVKPDADNLRLILDAFQSEGWPKEIYDPFPVDSPANKRRQTVATLNMDLDGVRFYAAGLGRRIGWRPSEEDQTGSTQPT